MFVIHARNVNDAYLQGVAYVLNYGEWSNSRAGRVLSVPWPVATCYEKPMERVLFNSQRNANPFFHLMEGLFHLAGRNDATWLDCFVSDFSKRFAEADGIQYGSYGFRWRKHFGDKDQLDKAVELLIKNPDDRRVVLTMWDPVFDLGINKKDVPCNINIMLRIRQQRLDITVCCRSNDVIWGCYGANIVQFSILQEYLAARIGVGVGCYVQISNDFHVYESILSKITPLKVEVDPYTYNNLPIKSFVTNPAEFDNDLKRFMEWTVQKDLEPWDPYRYSNQWFSDTAETMFAGHAEWKKKNYELAMKIVGNNIKMASDWQLAASEWMLRRMEKNHG